MTFLGLEKPIEYGRQLIFDPSTALFVLDAQRLYAAALYNDYKQSLNDMKEFREKYGDFMTPILADQDWWNSNVNDPVKNLINDAYANGVDLLRSPQGRAMVSNLIASMPYGQMAFKRQRAKNAEEYYKNMAALQREGKYNKEFSEYLEEDPNMWDTNSAGVTSPTVFTSLKDATNDWYNNRTPRDLTPEEKKQLGLDPRYNYTGYFDSDLMNVAKGLTPGWQGTPISNYYRELAKRKLLAAGVENPAAEQVEAVLQRDIANALQEWLVGPKQGEADKFALEDYKFQHDKILQGMKNNSDRSNNPYGSNQYSVAELIRRTSSTRIVGQLTQEYGPGTLAKQRDVQIKNGLLISQATGGHSQTYKGRQMFKEAYQDNNYSAQALTDFIANQGFQKADDEPNTVIIPKHAFNRLSTLPELVSKTTGFRGKQYNSNLKNVLKNADEVRITFTGGNYGAYMKNATNQNHFECIVKVGKKEYNPLDATHSQWRYQYKPIESEGVYFDSHITSQPDDPRLGYLGTVNKKGKVAETPNLPITNSQDSKYLDAVTSDVYTTSLYVKGSDYNFDAPYTELTNYPNKP